MHRDHVENPTDNIINEMLLHLQDRLSRDNLDINNDFGLPTPDATFVTNIYIREIREELTDNIETLHNTDSTNKSKFNKEQREVYDTVIKSVNNDERLLISLDASGGTGKIFVLSTILTHVRSKREIALATATSGIAATLLSKGRTLHSRLKAPISITDTSTCNIYPRCATVELIRRCKLLVIDEVAWRIVTFLKLWIEQ